MINWLKYKIRNFFGFSRIETNGVFILINLMIFFIILPFIIELYFRIFNKLDFKKDNEKLDLILAELNSYKVEQIDINKTNPFEIKSLCNFNIILCKRIISYRNLLGGFIKKNQYEEIFNITKSQLKILKERTNISKNFIPKKINIKKCSFKNLIRHPYISYNQAKIIIRNKHKFKYLNSLLNKTNLNQKWQTKIKPYLSLQ